jgi:hypothetical protein
MRARHDIYRDGMIHVVSEKCSTCIFRPKNLMHLKPGRVKEMVDAARDDESGSIVCHQTIDGQTDHNAVCRGWFDGYSEQSPTWRLAHYLGVIEYDDPPKKEK